MNESIKIINSVELIPLEDTEVNPYLTRVRVKVFHLGENRNHSYIDKPTALSMAKTLRGNPIVARYREEDQDFTDHGEEMIINDKGVTFKVLTRPYGFIDLNAKVWFEDYNDTDEFGQVVTHTYLVTEGMIWTGIYDELNHTIMKNNGSPQSMELDPDTLQGEWSTKINPDYEIFIINDAIITKLCALGQNTEPCFLGASITPAFSELGEESFVKELLNFKNKFSLALKNNKGGNLMSENKEYVVLESGEPAPAVAETPEVEAPKVEPVTVVRPASAPEIDAPIVEEEKNSETKDKVGLENNIEIEDNIENFAKNSDKKKEDNEEESKSNENEDTEDEDDEKKKPSKNSLEEKYALLEQEYNDLKTQFDELKIQNDALVEFKASVEDKEKDELIDSFYMLSDDDKADVIKNKSNYTLDDIEKELSVICVRKKVNFNLDEEKKATDEKEVVPPTTYNINEVEDSLPAWLKVVEAKRNAE